MDGQDDRIIEQALLRLIPEKELHEKQMIEVNSSDLQRFIRQGLDDIIGSSAFQERKVER